MDGETGSSRTKRSFPPDCPPFHRVRRLGAGSIGTVFPAEQIGVGNRPVALKVLNRELLPNLIP